MGVEGVSHAEAGSSCWEYGNVAAGSGGHQRCACFVQRILWPPSCKRCLRSPRRYPNCPVSMCVCVCVCQHIRIVLSSRCIGEGGGRTKPPKHSEKKTRQGKTMKMKTYIVIAFGGFDVATTRTKHLGTSPRPSTLYYSLPPPLLHTPVAKSSYNRS